ncbi:MAG: hypothetical protein JWO82_680, partial [Akkermansiaceae bacterium]|nr:hypothetical protein [Akkermansiaceae bacterium]
AAFFPDERAAPLPVLLGQARTLIAAHHQEVGANREVLRQQEAKKNALRQVRAELPGQRQTLAALGESWQADALALGIPAGLRPQGALGLLRARVTLFAEFDRWRAASAEAQVLGQGIGDFEKEVADLVQALHRPSQGTESDVAHLWDAAAKAESAGEKARLLTEQIDAKTQDQELARAESARSQQQFGALLKEAGLADQSELAAFLLKLEERSRCTTQLATVRQLLAGLARGEALEDFVAKVRAEGEAGLMGALDAVNGEIAALESQIETRQAARQSWLAKRAGLEAASDAAATHQQQAELSLATLRRDAERFARLQLAISLLKARIDRFREQNQGPFMEKAGRWFAEITGGDFAGISAVFDAGDQPVLAGVRAGEGEQRMLEIAGMSEGTQDQLFLALRLAGLEMHPPEQEPLPLILDDLLVHFDDRRATSALQALHSFGARSQVILFTHHQHLVELATKQLGSAGLHLHRLRD